MVQKVQELWEYRELLLNLTKRELKVKYKRSILGFLWSLLNPILMTLIFTFVFAFILRIEIPANSHGKTSFAAFLLAALLAWNFFSVSLSVAVNSIVGSSNLVNKIYFPREILPISMVLANTVNFLLELLVLFIFLGVLGFQFYLYLPLLPLILLIHVLFTIGVCLVVSCLNVYFRDVQHLLGIALLVWFYATPVIYPMNYVLNIADRLPGIPVVSLYLLNPVTVISLAYRDILYYVKAPDPAVLIYATLVSVASLAFGFFLFGLYEPNFAEEV